MPTVSASGCFRTAPQLSATIRCVIFPAARPFKTPPPPPDDREYTGTGIVTNVTSTPADPGYTFFAADVQSDADIPAGHIWRIKDWWPA